MRTLSEVINESSRETSVFYVIKFVSGRYKDNYLSVDGEGYTASNYSVEYGTNDHSRVITNRNLRNAQKTLEHFNEWNERNEENWGEAVIVEITATQREVH